MTPIKVICPKCQRDIGIQTRAGITKIARHRSTETAAPNELPGHYKRCTGSGTVVDHG